MIDRDRLPSLSDRFWEPRSPYLRSFLVLVLVLVGCGGAAKPPARTPVPTATAKPAATATPLQQPAERCGAPDTPAKVMQLRTSDGLTLDGASVGKGDLGVVLLHEYPADLCGWWPYANYLAERGMRALAIDMRCLGQSECGERGKAGAVADVRAAIDELRDEGAKRVAIVGASYGGAIAVVAGAKLKPAAVVDLSGEQSLQALVPGYDDVDSLAAAPRLRAPALFVVAHNDQYTPIADMRRVYRAAGSRRKQIVVLPFEAGHGLSMLLGLETDWSPLAARVAKFLSAAR
jgi:pimeloyl-ACP methyl ester carboxylesterase